jgi:hypothetical protein
MRARRRIWRPAPTRKPPIRAPRIRTSRATTTAGAATRTDMQAATRTAPTTLMPTPPTSTRLTATGPTLTPFISSSIVTAFPTDSMAVNLGSADIVGSTDVEGSGGIAESLSVEAGLAILGGSAVSADVEEASASLALKDQGVDLQAPHAAVPLVCSGDPREVSAVIVDSVIRVFLVALTPAAVSAAAHAWPLDRPEDAEGRSRRLR